jgi:hypothetical protein
MYLDKYFLSCGSCGFKGLVGGGCVRSKCVSCGDTDMVTIKKAREARSYVLHGA